MENLMEVVLVASLMDALLDFPYQKLIWKLNLTEDKFGQSRGARLKFLFFFGCTHDLSTTEDYSEMSTAYRPSHADATCDMKYGARAVQGGGRSSARETIGRVAAGAVAKKILETLAGTEACLFC
uniref:chorismate synthase n=1 Tax=Quercus lobata TaxID=97700 RepID=A0A7N2MM42_QUELO